MFFDRPPYILPKKNYSDCPTTQESSNPCSNPNSIVELVYVGIIGLGLISCLIYCCINKYRKPSTLATARSESSEPTTQPYHSL